MGEPKFEPRISSYEQISEIAGGWSADDYRKLLEELEMAPEDATSDAELRDLCLMCLQDREIADAAKAVLKLRLGDRFHHRTSR